jgi:uncharacterized BrkB/YihY/UPF0761 family membrane protein
LTEEDTPATSPQGGKDHEPPVLHWRGRLEALQRTIMRTPPLQALTHVMRAYDRGGGGMLAAALAYFAFFTMVPTLLLFVGVLGVVIEDSRLREQLILGLVDQIDPLRELLTFLVEGLANSGRTGTIVGLLGLMWGASGFYGALQGAMQRMFPGPGGRDFFQTRLRGVVTVVTVLGVLVIAVVLIFVVPFVTGWLDARCAELQAQGLTILEGVCSIDLVGLGGALGVVGAMGVAFLLALGIYVAIPIDGPSVRQAFWPAVVAGMAIGLFTALFGWISPLLVRNWVALGIVGNVFVGLIWLNLTFQALVFGAAWARLRRDRARISAGPPRL